ncbi:hypothetical protein, partial [Mycoplasma sp. 1012]
MSLIKKVFNIGLLTVISATSFISCSQIQKEEKRDIGKKEEEKFEWKYDETKIKEIKWDKKLNIRLSFFVRLI